VQGRCSDDQDEGRCAILALIIGTIEASYQLAAGVTMPIPHFVAVEVLWSAVKIRTGFLASGGHRAMISMIGMEVVIDMATEVSGAVKPWAGADEDSSGKPLRAIVAVRSAAVGSTIVVAIRAVRGYADFNGNLGLRSGSTCRKAKTGGCSQCNNFQSTHKFTSSR
jgi:hypothetical protein